MNTRCNKCGGNLFLVKEDYDWYLICLQCDKYYPLKPLEILNHVKDYIKRVESTGRAGPLPGLIGTLQHRQDERI